MNTQTDNKPKGPDLKALGFNSPMDIIDLLALLKVDGKAIVSNNQAILDPKLKAQAVMEYFQREFKIQPSDLPYLASLIKQDLKHGKIGRRNI
ncbi:MAG: hypothetical protein ABIE84_00945 [bacterium]